MISMATSIPFPVQTLFYRRRMQALKLAGKALALVIRMPEVFAGPGSSLLLCDAISGTGVRRLLIVTDAMLVKIGLVEPLRQRLSELGLAVSIYDGVLPDPTVDQIEAGLAQLRQEACTAILAIGGGSAMDAAKLIAARATNDKPVAKMTGVFKLGKAPLPMYAVPTTAGTGSEVTVAAVVSDPASKSKLPVIDPKLLPLMVALDGGLMTGLPPAVTAATGMDALTHAIEAYISGIVLPETDQLALEATTLIMRHLPRVMADGKNADSRQMMARASYRAGLAFGRAGVGYVHGIAHNLGAHYHIPHGLANAIVLPYVLEYSKSVCIERLAELARVSGLAGENASAEQLADRLIAHIRTLNRQFDIPEKLKALQEADIPAIAAAALHEAHFTYAVPRYMDQATCERLLRQLMD